MRRTDNSIIETFCFPDLMQMDAQFMNENGKYIRMENTFILKDKKFYSYNSGLY